MSNAFFNIGGTFKRLNKWYVKSPPSAPVLNFDGSNDPLDKDEAFKTHIRANLGIDTFNFTNPPQGSSILLPSFTLGNKFDLEFRYKADATNVNNELSCIFTTQHDRQGIFSDSVFAIYPLAVGAGQPADTLAIHFAPLSDPNGHRPIIISGDGTTVDQTTVFGGQRVLFTGLYDGNWHTFRFSYDSGAISATMDNDDNNFSAVTFYSNANDTSSVKTSVLHGSGFGASSFGRLMGSYSHWDTYINANGFDVNPANTSSTPRYNAHAGSLDFFKLTTYPSGIQTTLINYPIKDGVSEGSYQPIADISGNNNVGQHIYASDVTLSNQWDYTAGNTDNWRLVKEAYYNDSGVWKKFYEEKIVLKISTTTADYDLFTQAGSPATDVEVILYIESGVNVYSTTTSHGAIYGSSNFTSGSNITIINNGTIWGKGGDGGDCPYATGLMNAKRVDSNQDEEGSIRKTLNVGGSASDVQAGEDGGDCITLCGNTTVNNTFGRLFAGGGGGGATRIYNYSYDYFGQSNFWTDASCAGGGGAGYVGGTGGGLVKKQTSWNWANPASSINKGGTIWGAGDTTTIKANDGGRTKGAKALVGCHNLEYLYESDYYGKGGDLGEAGLNHNHGKRKWDGRGADLRIVANNGGRGYCVHKNTFTLTFIGSQTDTNRFRGGIFDPSSPPSDDDGVGSEHNIASDTNPANPSTGGGGCCVLSTACFYQDLITPDELMGMIRWRIRTQRKEFLADAKWLGYQIGFKPLASLMMFDKQVANFIYKYLVKDWIKKSQGKGTYPVRTFLVSAYCLLAFVFNYKKCIELSKTTSKNPREILKSYKKIIQAKDFKR